MRRYVKQVGQLSDKKMITVVHVFPESDLDDQKLHLQYWYGTVRPESEMGEDPNFPVVCWCGGKHVRISDNVTGVWHIRSWGRNG